MQNQTIHELKETRKRTLKTLERVKKLNENDKDRILSPFFEKQLKSRIKFIDKLLKEKQNEAKKMG